MTQDSEQVVYIPDLPAEDPGQAFNNHANAVAKIIVGGKTSKMTIGVIGGYGSGKTTLMNSIKKQIKKIDPSPQNVFVDFNAWRYSNEENLIFPLMSCISNSMEPIETNSKMKFASAIRSLIYASSFNFGIINFNSKLLREKEDELLNSDIGAYLSQYKDPHDILIDLTTENGCIKRKIILFIDDLDRCIPEKAFNLLESLKNIMDVDGYYFIVGLNTSPIYNYLSSRETGHYITNPQQYFEKIFQLSLTPPQIPQNAYEEITAKLVAITQNEELIKNLQPYMYMDIRKMKQMTNSFAISTSLKVNRKNILFALILKYKWSSFYSYLSNNFEKINDIIHSTTNIIESPSKQVLTILENDRDLMEFIKTFLEPSIVDDVNGFASAIYTLKNFSCEDTNGEGPEKLL